MASATKSQPKRRSKDQSDPPTKHHVTTRILHQRPEHHEPCRLSDQYLQKFAKLIESQPRGFQRLLEKMLRAMFHRRPINIYVFFADFLEAELDRRTLAEIQFGSVCYEEIVTKGVKKEVPPPPPTAASPPPFFASETELVKEEIFTDMFLTEADDLSPVPGDDHPEDEHRDTRQSTDSVARPAGTDEPEAESPKEPEEKEYEDAKGPGQRSRPDWPPKEDDPGYYDPEHEEEDAEVDEDEEGGPADQGTTFGDEFPKAEDEEEEDEEEEEECGPADEDEEEEEETGEDQEEAEQTEEEQMGESSAEEEQTGEVQVEEKRSRESQRDGEPSGESQLETTRSKESQIEGKGSKSSQLEAKGSKSSQLEAKGSKSSQLEAKGSKSSQLEAKGSKESQREGYEAVVPEATGEESQPTEAEVTLADGETTGENIFMMGEETGEQTGEQAGETAPEGEVAPENFADAFTVADGAEQERNAAGEVKEEFSAEDPITVDQLLSPAFNTDDATDADKAEDQGVPEMEEIVVEPFTLEQIIGFGPEEDGAEGAGQTEHTEGDSAANNEFSAEESQAITEHLLPGSLKVATSSQDEGLENESSVAAAGSQQQLTVTTGTVKVSSSEILVPQEIPVGAS